MKPFKIASVLINKLNELSCVFFSNTSLLLKQQTLTSIGILVACFLFFQFKQLKVKQIQVELEWSDVPPVPLGNVCFMFISSIFKRYIFPLIKIK